MRVAGASQVASQFASAYESGRLVFFVGAGASRESGAVMPNQLLAKSAELFLPKRSRRLVDTVLNAEPLPGVGFKGIQPEVFYEQLLNICGDRRALGLWRVLSPIWLAGRGDQLQANINHLAIADYASRSLLPTFTTNFDTLIEDAARDLGNGEFQVLTPSATAPTSALYGAQTGAGAPRLFKLHGSIVLEDRETLSSLHTTMQSISAVNPSVLELMVALGRSHHFAFVGYSGSDIDYFPALADRGLAQPPFWFNPDGDRRVAAHSGRIGARQIPAYPSDIFHRLRPQFRRAPAQPNVDDRLAELSSDIPQLLTPGQKRLLLAACLHGIGRNDDAEALLTRLAARELPARDRALTLLLLARVQDCTSRYVSSVRNGQAARKAIADAYRRSEIDDGEATAMAARALYQVGMSRQQQIGPAIDYGQPRLSWRPSARAMLSQLAAGIWLELRFSWTRRRLAKLAAHRHSGDRSVLSQIRAEHAMNDHRMMVLGRLISLAESFGLSRAPVLNRLFVFGVTLLLDRARGVGDYFVYAGAQKYLHRLGARPTTDAADKTYGLLRDPLNYALVLRDQAAELARQGQWPQAGRTFGEALDASRYCGSRATALKSIVGLAACGVWDSKCRRVLAWVEAKLEGDGYARFLAWVRPRLPP